MWKLNNIFLNNQWVKELYHGKLENTLRLMKKIIQNIKTHKNAAKIVLRWRCMGKCLY